MTNILTLKLLPIPVTFKVYCSIIHYKKHLQRSLTLFSHPGEKRRSNNKKVNCKVIISESGINAYSI
jgi:hypothetical protein